VQQVFTVTFPFFALVLCGYLAARRRLLPESAIPGLNAFVLYFALPCMLFRFGAGTPIAQLLDLPLMLLYAACALAIVAVAIAISRSPRIGMRDAAFGALVAAFPNTGFMGVPLLIALLGPQAAAPTIVLILVDMIMTTSLCIALSQWQPGPAAASSGPAGGSSAALARALKGVLANPLPWAITLGALASVASLQLPRPLAQVVALLGDSASPVALFTIGAVLARAQQQAQGPTRWGEVLPVAAIKLFAHPLLVLAAGSAAIALGWPLDRFALLVAVLVAALPSASNVSILAQRYGADDARIARIIMTTTAAAFVSFSLLVWVLRIEPVAR
jgi:predicted permease